MYGKQRTHVPSVDATHEHSRLVLMPIDCRNGISIIFNRFTFNVYRPYLLMIMQAGLIKNTHTTVFQIGNNANEVCDHFGKAIRAGSKSGIQMSRENICKSIFSSVSLAFSYVLRMSSFSHDNKYNVAVLVRFYRFHCCSSGHDFTNKNSVVPNRTKLNEKQGTGHLLENSLTKKAQRYCLIYVYSNYT